MTAGAGGGLTARTGSMRLAGLLGLVVAAALLGGGGASAAEPAASKENQLKAAFLFHFAKFIEWPAGTFAEDATPIRIGILGEDPFGAALDETVRGEAIKGRKLEVLRSSTIDGLAACQILYIGASEKAHVAEVLAKLADKPVLTVSDLDHFATGGGSIRFYLEDKRIRFEINKDSAQEQHHLKVSAQLLGLGKVVATAGAGDKP